MYRSAPPTGPTCARHPAAPAIAQCAQCQAHICTPCGLYRELALVCPACAQVQGRVGARKAKLGRALVGAGLATLALATISMGVLRAKDPNNWRERRHTIEALVGEATSHPCAAPPLLSLVHELVDAGDLPGAGRALDRVADSCRFPVTVHKLAYKVHMNLHQHDAAARDAQRRIGLNGRDREAYIDLARAYDRAGEPILAARADLAALVLDCKDTATFARVRGRFAAIGAKDRAADVAMLERKCGKDSVEDPVNEIDVPLLELASSDPVLTID